MGLPGLGVLKEFAAIVERAEGLSVQMREIPNLGRVFDLPGGAYVLGSAVLGQVPHWVAVDRFAVPETAVTEALYRRLMGRAGLESAPEKNPASHVSWNDSAEFYRIWNETHGSEIPGEVYGFASHAQSEFTLRGPAVDRQWMTERMEREGIPRDWDGFLQFASDRLENVVTELAGGIIKKH